MTWGDVAEAYHSVCGTPFAWVSDEEYMKSTPTFRQYSGAYIMWKYDRKYNRDIDPQKVLRVSGLTRDDFSTIVEGIRSELAILGETSK